MSTAIGKKLLSGCHPVVFFTDQAAEDADSPLVRYRPETLKELCRVTKFSKKEIQLMYRGFKQVVSKLKDILSCQ